MKKYYTKYIIIIIIVVTYIYVIYRVPMWTSFKVSLTIIGQFERSYYS